MKPTYLSAAMEEAWQGYLRALEEIRQAVHGREWAKDGESQMRAAYLFHDLQAAAFNLIIAPRQHYPAIYEQFQPLIHAWSTPSVDFNYPSAFLDGNRTYRIWGKRNTSRFVEFQSMNVFWGGLNARKIANYDLDEFEIQTDGTFEIIASAEAHPGNWIKLESAADESSQDNFLFIREAFYDWNSETGMEIHVEYADSKPRRPVLLGESEFIRRLGNAERFINFIVWEWAINLTEAILRDVGTNEIYTRSFEKDQGAGNNPQAIYPTAVFNIGPDEALILESEVPSAQYWNVQLSDIWWQILDYSYHQTSLNGHQAAIDSDGKFRAVVAHVDPGIANWIDTQNCAIGIVVFRYYRFDRPVTPTLRKVPINQLKEYLPRDTKLVSPAERAKSLAARIRGSSKRYNPLR